MALTSNGEGLIYSLNPDGTVLTAATAGGREVFTIELSSDNAGEYTVTLLDNVDHDASRGNDDEFFLPFNLIVTDSDGDVTNTQLRVTFQDDTPVIGSPQDASIDADVLLTANSLDDSIDGSLDINFGSDDGNNDTSQPGDRSVSFADTGTAEDNVAATSGGNPVTLTSNGDPVNFSFIGDTLVGHTGADPSTNQVFTVSLDDATGSYEFTLLANVDFDGLPSAADNVIDLTFDFAATDGDGDSTTGEFSVTVTDTAPVRLFDAAGNLVNTFDTIQAAEDAASDGFTVLVLPGTYNENLVIDTEITLVSLGGRDVTTIQGQVSGSENATITVAGGTDNVSIGTDGTDGFTIIGFDKGNPAIENAAVYVLRDAANTPTDNFNLIGNDVRADGEAALLSDWNAQIINAVIDGNIFSGKTFQGLEPASGDQFVVPNVARQLIAFGQGSDPTTNLADNITFSNNQITGTAGGTVNGNNLVTIDAGNSSINNNVFTGDTVNGRFALRTRGPNTDIENNTLDHTTGGNSSGMSVNNQGTAGTYTGNVLTGGPGEELILSMTPGVDTINTGAGDDVIVWTVGSGNDQIDGGEGGETNGDTLAVVNDSGLAKTFTLDAPGDGGDGFTVAVDAETVDVDNVEEVSLTLSGLGDTVNITGDFAASGVNVSTISVDGGVGNDEVDASLMGHSTDASKVGIAFNGGGGDDRFESGVGNDTFDGGEGTDTIVLSGNQSDYTLTGNPDGSITISDNSVSGRDGVDTITASVENIGFEGGSTVVTLDAVRVFDGTTGELRGTYATVQDAIDNGTTVDGDTVQVIGQGAPFSDSVTVDKALNFVGVDNGNGLPVFTPTTGSAFTLSGDLGSGNTVSFNGFIFNDAPVAGISLGGGVTLGTLNVTNSAFTSNYRHGIEINGAALGNAVVTNSTFTDNGGRDTGDPAQSSSGDGDILFFQYGGNATLQNLVISNGGQGVAPAENAIQFRGDGLAMGDVILDNIAIQGSYEKQPIGIFNYTGIGGSTDGLQMTDVTVTADSTSFQTAINFDGIGGDIDFSDATKFNNVDVSGAPDPVSLQGNGNGQTLIGKGEGEFIRAFGGDDTLRGNGGNDILLGNDRTGASDGPGSGDIDTAEFSGSFADYTITFGSFNIGFGDIPGFTIVGPDGTDQVGQVEVLIFDNGGSPETVRIVGQGGYESIQAAVDAANPGDTILIAPGSYTENVVVTKANLTILGEKAGVAGDGGTRGTGESSLTGMLRFAPGSNGSTVNGLQILQGGALLGAVAAVYVQADNITVTNMLMERTGGFGTARGVVTATGDAQGLDVSASKISGFATGIYLNPGSDATINGNVLEANNVGLSNDGPDASDISGNSFIDNVFEQIGIGVLNPGTTDVGSFVSGNTFTGSAPEVSIYDLNAGDQTIIGTEADDVIIGGAGADTLTGGAGDDTFIINNLSDVDIITDYTEGEDRIDLTALLAGVTGLTSSNVGEYVRVQGDTLQVDVDGGADSFVDAATLNGVQAGDIVTILDDTDTTAVELSIASV